jgi:tetratricopeptide (TPR) repeat protein
VSSFAGRAAELAVLDEWLEHAARGGAERAVAISAVCGMAGVGKTALAVYWAHRVADRFPDGQMYVNLRGYDPGGQPADAGEVVRGFLLSLGVAPERIPASLDGQAALYRSVLADRRMLIVADNARNAAQVRPLLPGAPGNVVLVTSRSNLGGLAAAEGARILGLDVLTEADAAGLLSARLGPDRVAAEPEAVAGLIGLCARLPLALAIVAARAELSCWPLAVLARRLAGAGERLGLLGLGDPPADVRAVFSWSLRQLSGESARMFRLLALHPGPDISVSAAASLAAVPVPQAQAHLGDSDHAVAWFHAEHHALLAVIAQAARAGRDDAARRIAWTLEPFFERTSNWQDLAITQQTALDCSSRLDDQAGRARSHLYLGRALARQGHADAARAHLEKAAELSHVLADRSAEARAHLAFSVLWLHKPDLAESISSSLQALQLAEADADLTLMAHACNNLGYGYAIQHDIDRALEYGGRAVDLCRQVDAPCLQAHAADSLGYIYGRLGDQPRASASYRRAAALFQETGAPYLSAQSLISLGDCHQAAGDIDAACHAWHESLTILDGLNHPDACQLRGKLRNLESKSFSQPASR